MPGALLSGCRFHLPVGGTIRTIRHVRGKLLTVNPIAVASTYANVFTEVRCPTIVRGVSTYCRSSHHWLWSCLCRNKACCAPVVPTLLSSLSQFCGSTFVLDKATRKVSVEVAPPMWRRWSA